MPFVTYSILRPLLITHILGPTLMVLEVQTEMGNVHVSRDQTDRLTLDRSPQDAGRFAACRSISRVQRTVGNVVGLVHLSS